MTVLDSDILRWMAMADEGDKKKEKRAKKWKNEIRSWLGQRLTGEWVSEPIATNVKRRFERHTHGAESTPKNPVIVKQVVEEIVYAHHGYRPHIEGEKNTRKSFFFRGARVWRE